MRLTCGSPVVGGMWDVCRRILNCFWQPVGRRKRVSSPGVGGASSLRNSRISLSAGRRACKPAAKLLSKPVIPGVILVHCAFLWYERAPWFPPLANGRAHVVCVAAMWVCQLPAASCSRARCLPVGCDLFLEPHRDPRRERGRKNPRAERGEWHSDSDIHNMANRTTKTKQYNHSTASTDYNHGAPWNVAQNRRDPKPGDGT
jgi:hypothetical protein